MIEKFFQKIDRLWKPLGHEPMTLHLIGSTALILQTDYHRATKDTDIIELGDLPKEVWTSLQTLAGKGTRLAHTYHLYVDVVISGLPFLPPKPLYHPLRALNKTLKHLRLKALDPVDIVVSKLKTFRPSDLDDIQAMIDRDLIESNRLVERFESAKEQWLLGSRAPELRDYVKHLHMIQRDYLFVRESPIELPDWLD